MRATVVELPHEPAALQEAWSALCRHTANASSELLLLPELAFVEPLWEQARFDAARAVSAVALSDAWLRRLPELGVPTVIGARPVHDCGRFSIEAFRWEDRTGAVALRRKYFLPNEPGAWEARWFERGEAVFPAFRAGELTFGLNVCSELWALETYGSYLEKGVKAILAPRATAAATIDKWLALGRVAAVRSGAYCLSSNRVDPAGTCGGVGWIIDPDGSLLAATSSVEPFATRDLDLTAPTAARATYPRSIFSGDHRA